MTPTAPASRNPDPRPSHIESMLDILVCPITRQPLTLIDHADQSPRWRLQTADARHQYQYPVIDGVAMMVVRPPQA